MKSFGFKVSKLYFYVRYGSFIYGCRLYIGLRPLFLLFFILQSLWPIPNFGTPSHTSVSPFSLEAATRVDMRPLLWHSFPAEMKNLVIEKCFQDNHNHKMASLATVSREWQALIEPYTFARIRLTPHRIAEFDAMTSRNRRLVRYLWLCLELERYDCTACAYGPLDASDGDVIDDPDDDLDEEAFATKPAEDALIRTALQGLFSALGSQMALCLSTSVSTHQATPSTGLSI